MDIFYHVTEYTIGVVASVNVFGVPCVLQLVHAPDQGGGEGADACVTESQQEV